MFNGDTLSRLLVLDDTLDYDEPVDRISASKSEEGICQCFILSR